MTPGRIVTKAKSRPADATSVELATAIDRRSFLKTASIAGATVALGTWSLPCPAAGSSTAAAPTPSWVDKPMRWAQLTLVEDDPGKFDPQFWLDYFKRTR